MHNLLRWFMLENMGRNFVYNESGKLDGKGPILFRKFLMIKNVLTNILKMLMFSLDSPILLGTFNTWPLMKNSFRYIEFTKHEFMSIVSSDNFRCCVKLVDNHVDEIVYMLWNFIFVSKSNNPKNILWSSSIVKKSLWFCIEGMANGSQMLKWNNSKLLDATELLVW